MKRNITKIFAALALLVFMMPTMAGWGQTRDSYSQNYSSSDITELLPSNGNWASGNGFVRIPDAAGKSEWFTLPIDSDKQPTSDISLTFNIATYGSGDNPTSSNSTITAVGSEANSNWNGSGVSNYPTSSSYVNGVMTIAKPTSPTTLSGLTITIGVDSGVRQFRVKSITVAYTYDGGTPVTYNVSFDAGDGTFVGNTDFPNASNTVAAGTYNLPSATPAAGYTFEGWLLTGSTEPITGSYLVSGDASFTASYSQNGSGSGETLTFDFEDNTAHRTSGNNSYTGTNTYTENGVTISLTYADAVTSGTPISGTANFMGRVAKNTTNSPSMIIGPIDMQNWASVSKVAFKTNGSDDITEKFFISTDGANYTEVLSFSLSSTTSNKTADNLDITGNQLYLKWTGAVAEVNTTSNRDFRIDDIVITYTVSAVTTPALTVSPNSLNGFEYVYNYGPSQAQTISISGSYLSDNVILAFSNAANSDFEMSTDNTNWQSTNITLTPTNGALAETNVYVRLKSGKAVNSYSDQLSVSSTGATSTSMNLSGTVAQLMTVAQAMTAIYNASGNTVSNAYVHGYVCQIDNYSSNRITYWISDDGLTATKLEVYNGYGLNGANFTSINDLTVGDEVVVYGNLTLYNSSVYEFSAGSRLVSHVHNVIPIINAANTMNMNYNHTAGEIAYTITNSVQGESLIVTADATWITNISVLSDKVTIYTTENDEQQARTATITLSYEGAIDKTVTVTQGVYTPGVTGAEWVLTDLAELTANDVFVIVGTDNDTENSYAMPNNGGASAPLVVSVTIEGNKIVSEVTGNLQWNLTIGQTGYTFAPNESSTTYLYCIDNNNGLRVGTGSGTYSNVFTLASNGYLTATPPGKDARYVGIYFPNGTAQDWRSYKESGTQSNGNIYNQSFAFYKKVDAQPESYTKTIQPYTANAQTPDRYYLIASPVECAEPSAANGFLANDYDLYRFDQGQEDEWLNYKTTPFYLLSGHGYLYANSGNNGNNGNATTLTFTGTAYSGNGQVSLSKVSGASWEGWNLIGNPYATAAVLKDAAGTNNQAYYKMNSTGTEIEAGTLGGDIADMEGVFVIAANNGDVVTFVPSNNGKSAQLSVNVNKGMNTIDRAIVRFDNGGQLPKFQLNPNSTKVYIAEGNQDFAVVRSANQGEMPVNFKASENGTYTISANAENMEMTYLHLIDNMTGADVDLLANPSYTFDARTTDYTSRFRLVFNGNSIDENTTDTETFAYFNGESWSVSNQGEAILQVVDVMGRIINTQNINGNATINLNETPGIYMLRLVNGNNVKVQKIVVR